MRAALRHPILILISVAGGAALALVATAGNWSDAGLYGGMVGVIAVIGLLGALLEIRRSGPRLFAGRDPGRGD